jgi:hypothetical protein
VLYDISIGHYVWFVLERELVTLNEKPLIVAYRNTGTPTRALREHKSTKEHKSTVTGQVCNGALEDHKSTAEHNGARIDHRWNTD